MHTFTEVGKARRSPTREVIVQEATAQVRVPAEVAEGNQRNVGSETNGRHPHVVPGG